MKKQILFSALILGFFYFFSFTQAQSLGDIDLKFCENYQEKQVDVVTNSDQDTSVCVSYTNNSDNDAILNINFVDGIVNSSGGKSCGIPSDPNLNFGQYVKNYDPEVEIPAHKEVKQHYTIHFPAGYSGISHGCITYDIKKKDTSNGNAINFVFRKTFSIDILVGGSEVNPKLIIRNLSITGDETSQQIILELVNNGNTDQDISLSGEIKNRFGYRQGFEIAETTIPANENLVITSTNLTVPSYEGLFFVRSNLKNIPIFNFDITNTKYEMEYSLPGTTIFSNTIILWNWIYITLLGIIVILLIFIAIKSARKKRKRIIQKKKQFRKDDVFINMV